MGLVPTKEPELDFSQTCGFCETLDSVELITYIKFQSILMTGYRDPRDSIQKSGSVTCLPYHYPNFMPKIENTNRWSLSNTKTD